MSNPIEQAIQFALTIHTGQTDKGSTPYILHALRVGMAGSNETEQLVGFLHDCIEDGPATAWGDMVYMFGDDIAKHVKALSRDPLETYEQFIERVRRDPIAIAVKLNDLADNMQLWRLGRDPTPKELARFKKYQRARHYLLYGEWLPA